MSSHQEFRPNKEVFIYFSFLSMAFFFGIIFAVIGTVAKIAANVPVLTFIVLYILLMGWNLFALFIKYSKERYIFYPNKIVRKSGGVFHDHETELVVKNITNVRMFLPFIRYHLFGIGNISIEAAGGMGTEVFMNTMDGPHSLYEHVQKVMMHNGFKLSKAKLIQEESPHPLGAFFEALKGFFGFLFAAFFFGVYIFNKTRVNISGVLETSWFWPLVFLLFIITFTHSFMRFLDLLKRKYRVYSDTITYSEGFLSKNYAVMPAENLADAEIKQNIVDRIFGLYDVKVSCQGTVNHVLFKNMRNGKLLEENIDRLIEGKSAPAKTHPARLHAEKHAAPRAKASKHTSTPYTHELRMDMNRTIFPWVFLAGLFFILSPIIAIFTFQGAAPLSIGFVVMIVLVIGEAIRVKSTKYFIKQGSFEEAFKFLSSKNLEFTTDKTTSILVHENFIDRFFNTVSIHFWSIGSSATLKFRNIKKSKAVIDHILEKEGISTKETLYKAYPQFSFGEMLKMMLPATLGFSAFLFILLMVALFAHYLFIIPIFIFLILFLLIYAYAGILYDRASITLFRNHVAYEWGFLFKTYYYALYDDIKDIQTTRYPFSTMGTIRFNVAGETLIQRDKNKQIVSNSFAINFIEGIDTKDELIDLIFHHRPTSHQIKQMEKKLDHYSPQPLLYTKPDLANALVPTIIGLAVFFFIFLGPMATIKGSMAMVLPVFAVYLLFALGILIWIIASVKATSYVIQPYRVYARWGIFYKNQKSIIFDKIDYISFREGFLNKIFSNGNVTINTTGSSSPELTVTNIPNYREFYELVKKKYE